ncbi:restriction endonuclease subunit R [Pasteurellaceae bacterium 15-036681]|nr:restriction endonuclease subunit R [Pasteurellaceae bacterium 15-036681]
MSGFNYEAGLPHQEKGVQAVLNVFDNATLKQDDLRENPVIQLASHLYQQNIRKVQQQAQNIELRLADFSNILDISMETGTGKTYTYTKTMYDLYRCFGLFKFIVVVPTLSIKAGTKNFLKSTALKQHFQQDFNGQYPQSLQVELYEVESKKSSAKNKKAQMPTAIAEFIGASNANKIHVLLINAGMVNSATLTEKGDYAFKDLFDNALDGIASVRPIMIIDEPHRFPTGKKTMENLLRFNAQYILRYGATFNEQYHNLIYRLTAVDAFNQDLVKGIRAYVEKVEGDSDQRIKLVGIENKQAIFELSDQDPKEKQKKLFRLEKGESLSQIHSAIHDVTIEDMNTSKVVLSTGNVLTKGNSLSPYSYSLAVEDQMMSRAIKEHFKLERELLTQNSAKIKPLTLFFIDDIEGYRDGNNIAGSLKTKFEQWVKAEAKACLETEQDPFYREYLQKTISDIELTHGGYFSKDNSESDEKIEQEINEILHDKEALLSLDNPRRFIFSKWTLREGWDNPNVFQICKLRSSGSITSKLQEVGRGLRLPVNQYMERVKDHGYYLNYFVDSYERDFVKSLISEVNQSSNINVEHCSDKLDETLIVRITKAYPDKDELTILVELKQAQIIDGNRKFVIDEPLSQLQQFYPNAFSVNKGVDSNKIINASEAKKKSIPMRAGKYEELKALWELINQKAILQYKFGSEQEFLNFFIKYLHSVSGGFAKSGIRTEINILKINNDGQLYANEQTSIEDDSFIRFNTMSYKEFLEKLAQLSLIKMDTLHQGFYAVREQFKIEEFLNMQTILLIKNGFSQFLLNHSIDEFNIGYQMVNNQVHPTKFTYSNGRAVENVSSADLGVDYNLVQEAPANYLFSQIFYDSTLEHHNIANEDIQEVTVFTKIPKNSIKIPVAGGGTYSPDFAYIIKTKQGEILNFVIETKNVSSSETLRRSEQQKIRHAESLFAEISKEIKVVFKTQFEGEKVSEIIRRTLSSS